MLLLLRITLTCQFVYLKKRDLTESRYGQNISSRSASRKLGQVDDQGMRVGFILSGIHVTTGRRVRSRRIRGNGSKHRYDKSSTLKFTPLELVS